MDWEGVVIRPIARHEDSRGWLIELFRSDELPEGFSPSMGYFSVTLPGVTRGPHEHRDQTDGFVFFSGSMELHLWENRPGKPSRHEVISVGAANPVFALVPPGVVHAYRNVGKVEAGVMNFPDRLYAGWGKQEEVDEIRHENELDSPFRL
jgi:dTDP-4-dehydrorhamnose 3,5-epimerase